MRLVSRGCFLFLIASIFCPATIARSLVVGLPSLEPYVTQRGSEISGMYVEMLEAVFSHAGVDYTIRVMPPARMAHEFMNGSLDVTVVSDNMSIPSRFAYLTKEPLSSVRMMLMRREDSALEPIASTQRIRSSIAAIRGFSPELSFLSKSSVELVNSREQLLKMLFAGRVDYIVAEETVTSSCAQQHDFQALSSVLLLENWSLFAVFSKLRLGENAESLGNRFDASLRQFIQQGGRDKIIERYTGAPKTPLL